MEEIGTEDSGHAVLIMNKIRGEELFLIKYSWEIELFFVSESHFQTVSKLSTHFYNNHNSFGSFFYQIIYIICWHEAILLYGFYQSDW